MKKILLEDALILKVAKAARGLVHRLPFGVSLFIGRHIGTLVYYLSPRRHIAHKNLRAAFAEEKSREELKAIAKKSTQNMAMSAIELLRFPDLDMQYLDKHVHITGKEKFEPYLKEKKGIIFLTAHFGNWELLSASAGLLGYQMAVLARAQKHPRSDEFLNSLRASKGSYVIRKGMPIREILRSLKAGKIVGMLSDQDGGRNGTFVYLFNRLSSSPSGVATFALRTGAPIFPVFNFRENNTYHRVEVEGPLEVPDASLSPDDAERKILQDFAVLLESKIRKAPDQWLWAHRRWKSTPDRSVILLSDGKAGHLNQSLAIFESIKEDRETKGISPDRMHVKTIEVHYRSAFHQKILHILCLLTGGYLPGLRMLTQWCLDKKVYEAIMKSYADIVISCGSSLLAVNLFVKRENHAKSIAVMKPSFSVGSFDAVIVPSHDNMRPNENVFVTRYTPSLMTEAYLKKESESLMREFRFSENQNRIGLLVGGDTQRIKFDPKMLQPALEGIGQYSLDTNTTLLVTSSRRTPSWADDLLKKNFASHDHCPLLVIANESNRSGVVGGILGLCDLLIVTGESISMVSEALSSGKKVVVFIPANFASLKSKYRDFLNKLSESKAIHIANSGNMYDVIKEVLLMKKSDPSAFQDDRDVLKRVAEKVTK